MHARMFFYVCARSFMTGDTSELRSVGARTLHITTAQWIQLSLNLAGQHAIYGDSK